MTPYKYLVLTTTLAFTLFSTNSLFAQGWEILHEDGEIQFRVMEPMEASDGHFYILGTQEDYVTPIEDPLFLAKVSPEGQLIWIKNYPKIVTRTSLEQLPLERSSNYIFEEIDSNQILIVGHTQDPSDWEFKIRTFIISMDSGELISQQLSPPMNNQWNPNLIQKGNNDNYLVIGPIRDQEEDLFIQSYSIDGNLQWETTHNTIPESHNYFFKHKSSAYDFWIEPYIEETLSGNIIVRTNAYNIDSNEGYLQIHEFDIDGNLITSVDFGDYKGNITSTVTELGWFKSVDIVDSNKLVINYQKRGFVDSSFVAIIDIEAGTPLWTKYFSSQYNTPPGDLPIGEYLDNQLIVEDSTLMYATRKDSTLFFHTISIDSGAIVTSDTINVGIEYDDNIPSQIYKSTNNELFWFTLGEFKRAEIFKFSPNNEIEWQAHSTTWNLPYFYRSQILETSDQGFLLANTQDGYQIVKRLSLIKIDSTGTIFPSIVKGYVFQDDNEDCLVDTTDTGLENWIIVAESDSFGTIYSSTHSNGYFEFGAPEGSISIEAANPGPSWDFCFGNPIVDAIINSPDTLIIDFPLLAEADCPNLSVNLYTPRILNCFSGTYYIEYCNTGTLPAINAYIEVNFHDSLTIDGASTPWASQVGNTFTFELDTIDLWECNSFEVYFTSPCNPELLGQRFCSEAHIYPDTLCGETPIPYTGAFMEANAECQDSILYFYLQNTGQSPTVDEIEYVIIEDAVLQYDGQMPFDVEEQAVFPITTDGSTYWLLAQQEPGAPGNSQPIIGVEGCAVDGTPIITTGILNQFPFNDADPYLDIDCPEVTGSYDPNDKTASPVGYGSEHFVEKDQGFDYTIRFQNTGNDTAFKVVIRDTLSSHLDILSVRPGLSSHPYEFDVYGDRILQFTFNNILLPDSTTNEPESNGFVRFYVDQVTDNPNGTLIENNAGIYFDFNPPIITNTVWHTIGENFIIINNTTEATNENKLLKVYPNPFVETAYLDLPEANFKQGVMQLFNLSGQLVREEKFREFPVSLHRAGLPAGVYFLQLQLDDQAPITGRLVIGE